MSYQLLTLTAVFSSKNRRHYTVYAEHAASCLPLSFGPCPVCSRPQPGAAPAPLNGLLPPVLQPVLNFPLHRRPTFLYWWRERHLMFIRLKMFQPMNIMWEVKTDN